MILYSGPARRDLLSIWDWIAEGGGEIRADHIVKKITNRIDRLESYPLLGKVRPDIGMNARMLVCDRWLVLYRIRGEDVLVVRVVDGAVDLRDLNFQPD